MLSKPDITQTITHLIACNLPDHVSPWPNAWGDGAFVLHHLPLGWAGDNDFNHEGQPTFDSNLRPWGGSVRTPKRYHAGVASHNNPRPSFAQGQLTSPGPTATTLR